MYRRKIIGLAIVASLAIAAPASAEKDYDAGALGPGDAQTEWEGTGSGMPGLQNVADEMGCQPAVHECYDAVIEIKAAGKLTVTTSSDDPTAVDTDLQLFESDKDGNVKKELAESAATDPTPAESVSVSVKAGFYVARIDYTIASPPAAVKAVAVFKASAPKPATTTPTTGGGGTTPTGGGGTTPTGGPTPANGTPEAKAAKFKASKKLKGFTGTASDDGGVAKVEVGIITKPKGGKCKELTSSGKFAASKGNCNAPVTFLAAAGTTKWTFKLKKKLAKGSYILFVRAVDNAGATQAGFTPSNKIAFKVK
jgi:hypothetical protein